jgi:hypothetical protein
MDDGNFGLGNKDGGVVCVTGGDYDAIREKFRNIHHCVTENTPCRKKERVLASRVLSLGPLEL